MTGRRISPRGTEPVRSVLKELGRGARKSLGQHFLANSDTARRIVSHAGINEHDRVVEIGPGLGALTEHLVQTGAELWLVEVDRDLAERARKRWGVGDRIHVIEGDALSIDLAAVLGPGPPAILVSNLPYNVGTAILARLLRTPALFSRMVVMLQREVAERIRAAPGSSNYSALSVLTQVVVNAERALRVPPGAFVPRPTVDSEVVVLTPRALPLLAPGEVDGFTRLVRTAFTMRRKQLQNSLRPLRPDIGEFLRSLSIDPTRRPETLSLDEFLRLARSLTRAEASTTDA